MLTFALVIIAFVVTGEHQVGISFKNYKSNLLVVTKHETLVLILQSPTCSPHSSFGLYFFPSSMFALACKLAPAKLDSWNGNINFYAWKCASCTGGARGWCTQNREQENVVHGAGREGVVYMEQGGGAHGAAREGMVYMEQGETGWRTWSRLSCHNKQLW